MNSLQQRQQLCNYCGDQFEESAKYCGSCGAINSLPQQSLAYTTQFQSNPIPGPMPHVYQAANRAGQQLLNVPDFAKVHRPRNLEAIKALQAEAGKLLVMLARERIFLYLHWLLFIGLNIFGFVMALKCYNEFIADEMSKIMVASTPFLFINSVALCCIIPIKGTRGEIIRIKEQLSHIKFKLDYSHLL